MQGLVGACCLKSRLVGDKIIRLVVYFVGAINWLPRWRGFEFMGQWAL
jgi:hypothetical protein